MRRHPYLSPPLAAALLVGCLSNPVPADQPARIVEPTAASRAELERVVSRALYVEHVPLADDALMSSSVLVVERNQVRRLDDAPLAGRELGTPERFRLVKEDDRCVLVHEGSGRRFALPATRCAPER